jgi:predicted methyltransferase
MTVFLLQVSLVETVEDVLQSSLSSLEPGGLIASSDHQADDNEEQENTETDE